MDTNQQASREARRFLMDRVRNDWSFPDPPPPFEHSDEELHGVSEFRERYYGTTSDQSDSADDDDENGAARSADDGQASSQPYKFHSPEHVGQKVVRSLEERAARRKRKRRRVLEEEMQWNEGMSIFVRRRDVWTGAASVRKYARRRSRPESEMLPQELEAQAQIDAMLEETAVVESSSSSDGDGSKDDKDATDEMQEQEHEDEPEQEQAEPAGEQQQQPEQPPHKPRRNIEIPASEEPLVPLAPPLLPHNAIRQSISPKAYPDIYAKIVVSGQTPKVPINLADMTRALVQGWKDDGEWPPRPGPVDPLMGSRKKAAAGRAGAIAAVLGTGGGGGAGGREGDSKAAAGHHGPGEFLAHHPHLQRGVESVKKVFRLSGGGNHSTLVHDAHHPPAA